MVLSSAPDDKKGSAFPTPAAVELEFVARGTSTMLALGDSGLAQLLMVVRLGEVVPCVPRSTATKATLSV